MNRIGDSLFHTGENKKLVQAFASNEVDFVLIGGLAIAWYCPQRNADDMDLLVSPTPENSRRISTALKSLHLEGFTEASFERAAVQVRLKQNLYAELLTPHANGPTYEEVASSAIGGKIFNLPIRIASIPTLLRLKELAISIIPADDPSRVKHISDIKLLQSHDA